MKNALSNIPSGRLWLSGFAVLLFILVVLNVFVQHNTIPDETVFSFIAPYRTAGFTSSMNFISFYGNHNFLVPANLLLVVYFFVQKKKQLAWLTLAIALSSLGLMSLIKNLVQRHRPAEPLVAGVTNYSFPSGHAFMSVAFYGLLIWFTLTWYNKNKRRQQLVVTLLLLIIFMIGFSRIYLRLHYTTDVLAGLCLGSLWLVLLLTVADNYFIRRKES